MRQKMSALWMLLALTGCFEKEASFEVLSLKPARVSLVGIHTIAVLPMSGSIGAQVSTKLERTLRHHSALEVLDGKHVQAALGFIPSELDVQNAAFYAKRLGVDAVVYGKLEAANIRDRHVVTPIEAGAATRYERKVDVNLRATVHIATRHGFLLGSLALEAAESGVAAGESVVREAPRQELDYLHGLFPALDGASYTSGACLDMAGQFVQETSPRYENVEVVLFYDGSEAQSVAAVNAAQRGDWAAATSIYRQAAMYLHRYGDLHAMSMVYYNLGVALIYNDEPTVAAEMLTYALSCASSRRVKQLITKAAEQATAAQLAVRQTDFYDVP